jgi:hypothetical protein
LPATAGMRPQVFLVVAQPAMGNMVRRRIMSAADKKIQVFENHSWIKYNF